MKKAFPKKAKLICYGGFYKIIEIEKFTPRINHPFITKLKIITAAFTLDDLYAHQLEFNFYRVYRGYAEYNQVDFVTIENK